MNYNQLQPQSQAQETQQNEDAPPTDEDVKKIISTLKATITCPPLREQPLQIDAVTDTPAKRIKRKSKFSKEQDEMIIDLKRKGKSWVDIAEITGVGSFLTARNRYQVLMGQQGAASTVWSPEDVQSLQNLVDEGELEKWRFISRELYKLTRKLFSDAQCREIVRELFHDDPSEFGITEETLAELSK
ncbi:Adherence factor [Cyberlindnera fabianii]|uniref:Adherence factor n=1 Tax=Cyberlindnera fabianii TaxID=36022 RepID=A0A1V2LC58_CYBFA|nr:Adherence factor [Cyberlindnera fabianii]